MIMIRLNNSYTPSGTFGTYGAPSPDGSWRIGYDAAVCVEAIEPWIVESYNVTSGSGFPSTLKIVKRGDRLAQSDKEDTPPWPGVQMGLNSNGKWDAFVSAHDNARNQILKVSCAFLGMMLGLRRFAKHRTTGEIFSMFRKAASIR